MDFPNIKKNVIEGRIGVKVRKEGKRSVNSNSELAWRETYSGSENTIVKTQSYQNKFICQFENIASYPFDTEICTIEIVYGGPTANLVALQPSR